MACFHFFSLEKSILSLWVNFYQPSGLCSHLFHLRTLGFSSFKLGLNVLDYHQFMEIAFPPTQNRARNVGLQNYNWPRRRGIARSCIWSFVVWVHASSVTEWLLLHYGCKPVYIIFKRTSMTTLQLNQKLWTEPQRWDF